MSRGPEVEYKAYVEWELPGHPTLWVIDCGACHYDQDGQDPIAVEATAKQVATGHRDRKHPGIGVRKGKLDRRDRQELRLRAAHQIP